MLINIKISSQLLPNTYYTGINYSDHLYWVDGRGLPRDIWKKPAGEEMGLLSLAGHVGARFLEWSISKCCNVQSLGCTPESNVIMYINCN